MATADISRKVSFQLFCGNLPITKVRVTVFQNDLEDNEKWNFSCVPKDMNDDGGRLWEVTATSLPTARELWYLYEFEVNNDSSTPIQEYYFRSLKPQNRNLCDVPTAHPKFKLSPSLIRTGIIYYLRNCFLKCLLDEEPPPLQTLLYDLEHCWHFIRFDGFEAGEMMPIRDWIMRQLHIYSKPDRPSTYIIDTIVAFFATVYGCSFSLKFQSGMSNLSIDLDKNDLETVRESIAGIRKQDLTEWSMMHLKQTGLMVLWSLKQLHWLTVVAYLGKMYDIDELLKAKQSVSRHRITIENVTNKVIPYILHNFVGNNEAITKLLLEIPDGWGFTEDEKSQLGHLVQRSLPKEDHIEDPTSTRVETKDIPAMGADDVLENPKVRFSLWTGKLDVAKVTLTISGPRSGQFGQLRQNNLFAIKTVDCQPTDPFGEACPPESNTEQHNILWVANVDGLHRYGPYLQYRYKCEIRHSGEVYEESNYRKLSSENRCLQDNLNLRFLNKDQERMRAIIFEGLMFHLQPLADGSQLSFETYLHDLEHMLQCREDIATQENVNCLLDWAEGLIGSMLETGNIDKLLLAAIVYGVMLSHVGHERTMKFRTFKPEQLRKIRNAIAGVHRDRLTKWCVPHMIHTGLAILWSLQTLHWLVVVAYFGRLYELDDLLEANKIQNALHTVNRSRIPTGMVFNVVIPRILNNFGTDTEATTKLMVEIPTSFRFTKTESDLLSQVVGANLPQQSSKFTLFRLEDADCHKEEGGAYEVENGELRETARLSDEYKTPTRFRLCVNTKNRKVLAITLHMCLDEGKAGTRSEKRRQMDIVSCFVGDRFTGSWVTAAKDIYIQRKQHTIKYQYSIVYLTTNFWGNEEQLPDKQHAWKSIVTAGTAYDIYHHNRHDYHFRNVSTCNTCAIGTFVHVDEILKRIEVVNDNLSQALNDLIRVGFPGTRNISREFANFFRTWLDRKLTKINNMQNAKQSHEWKQNAFLAILCAKVMKTAEEFEPGSIDRNNSIKLKEALSLCTLDDIPSSLHDEVEVICIWLIKVLDDNWIFFWQHCSNIIGIGRIQQLRRCVKPPNFSQNTAKEATQQVDLLSAALSNLNDKPDYSVALIVCVMEEIDNITILVDVIRHLSHCVWSIVENNKEVNDRASSRCEELLQVHKGNLKFMTDLWKDVKNLPIPGISCVVRNFIHRYLKHEPWSASDPNIQILIPDIDIYDNKENVLLFMKILLSSQTSCLQPYCPQSLFLKVVEESSILKLLEHDDLKSTIERGIQSVSSCHHNCVTPHHDQKIEIAKQLQHGISSSDYLKGDELVRRANELLDKLLKSVPLPDVLEYVCKATGKSGPEEDQAFLTRHINDQLSRKDIEEQTRVLTQVLRDNQIGGRLDVKSASIASILQKQMDVVVEDIFSTEDVQSLNERGFPNFEANIQALLRYEGFVSMILEVACNSDYKFTDHYGFNSIVTLLTLLPQKLTDGEISIAFLNQILKRKTDMFMMLKRLPNESLTDDKWQTICKSAKNRKDTFLTKRDFLTKLVDEEGYLADIARSAKVNDIKAVSKEVSTLLHIEEEGTLFLRRIEDPEYWGKTLFPLTWHATELIRLVDSDTFCNVCRSFFEGNIPDLDNALDASTSESTKASTDGQPTTFLKLIKTMHMHCLPIYRKYGLLIAQPDLDVSFALVSGLMEGIDGNEDMTRELSLMETVCGEKASTAMTEAISSLIKLDDVSQKARQLQSVFETFSITDENNTLLDALATLVLMSDRKTQEGLTLGDVHRAVEKIGNIEKKFDANDCWAVVEELNRCKELIRFLRSVIDEDLRNLIDVVEERSDQNVNEQTVSALLDVQRFMSPLLKMTPSNPPGDFIDAISSNVSQAKYSKASDSLSMKINACVHNVYSLEDLYKNVANRGEMTKEKIYNAVKLGVYEFEMSTKDDKCITTLTYEREGKRTTCGLEELNDLRSRALLIVNSKKATDTGDTSSLSSLVTQQTFVACVTTVNEIVQICQSLTNSGYFEFRKFENISGKDSKSLKNIREQLQTKFDDWQNDISEARREFFYLNFFQAKQFGILDRFFKKVDDVSDDLMLLLRFVNPSIKVRESLRDFYDTPEVTTPKNSLMKLGSVLQKIFKDIKYTERRIPGFKKVSELRHDSKVIPGNVFVAELESGSTKVINVLLHLYQHTTGSLPEPSQIVFCNANTTWEEVRLLLERCKALSQNNPERCKALSQNIPESTLLYTLVNVERLPTKTQFELVAEVKNMLKSNKQFLLAFICCTGHHHHIIDQFSPNYTHLLDGCGLSDSEMRNCFTTGWPCLEGHLTTASRELYDDRVASMTSVTSNQTGLGKSEYVKWIASSIDCSTNLMHVSGSVSKDQLIKMVKELPRRKRCILHIDVSQMEQRQLFDCFIFELVVVGMAVSGTLMCASPSSVVILEVANTQGHVLRNALPICCAFPRKHLEWPGFDGFIVSEDINSPVQVVCHYLKALENKTLDTQDIQLVGDARLTPFREDECRAILKSTFPIEDGISFTNVETFLRLFAQELQRMSVSIYFDTKNLKRMVKKQHTADLRSNFVRKLQEVSKQFAARSVKMSLAKPSISHRAASAIHGLDSRPQSTVSADRMVSRMKDMVMWNDSNHLFMVFHRRDSQTFTPIYRDIKLVPRDIQELLQTQTLDYETMDYNRQSHDDLQLKLEMICRKSNLPFDRSKLEDLESTYALTPDNFLKMVLIYLRIESKIPVVIMGETGCGKTTLVMYLARVCEIPFFKLNLHAGVTEERIASEMTTWKRKAEKARGREIWVFLDEINTSNHLGLLNDVVCHHKWKGERLPANLVFIAACNPYRLRQTTPTSAGLRAKPKWERDEQSKLVYRVHPLPESMMDYVWDYGALNEEDERVYIERMLGRNEYTFIELIVVSQKFLRKYEGNSHCVSLRDVNRCKHLKEYFMNKFFTSEKCPIHIPTFPRYYFVNRTDIRSMILALCHCYHSRLVEADVRKRYRGAIAQELNRRQAQNVNSDQIEQMMELEQMDLLDRMQLPSGIAKNEALRENVFVMLVSILNNIPVFVIGKPGCSKSLSMLLIKSNLRGPDSQDIYFKSLPPVYVISYQGSESSTSEGIIKVFDKAYNYKEHNPNVLPVVLLDEIGLAENSTFNPLRVLHSQLEPRVSGFPPIAVVGISNWELDSAKMNRAIHLSRPEPTEKDLKKTAVSIRDNIMTNKGENTQSTISDNRIQQLAEAYFNYQTAQILINFHGLRDYYNLIKYVATKAKKNRKRKGGEIVLQGLLRNFGGSKEYWEKILNMFYMTIPKSVSMVKVLDLITENIGDINARHLMLITRGDLALNILEQHLQALKPRRDYDIICGSKFSDGENEEYNYQMLSEIILSMESGVLLIMKDLEDIYESLYDMLNQNYTIVGKKRNCRVALGAHSNPMCQVHEDFRCIVIVDEKKLDISNPPFLNRFEKQFITMSEVMSDFQIEATKLLHQWTETWTEVRDDEEDEEAVQSQLPKIFLGYNKDTLASLTYAQNLDDKDGDGDVISDGIEDNPKALAETCQNGLLKIACPDGVLKLTKSKMFAGNQSHALELKRKYFSLPLHRGFHHFYESEISTTSNAQVIIYTHSSIHFDFKECLVGISCQVEKLSNFISQQDLSSRIQEFWKSDDTLLILQCMPSLDMDAANMTLAKCLLDQHRKKYLDNQRQSKETNPMKQMCIVVHFDRCQSGSTNQAWHFSFLCGWSQVSIDSLESTSPVLFDCLQNNMADIFDSKSVRWRKVIDTNMLIWCFNCIRYTEFPRPVDSSLQLAYSISQSDEIMTSFQGQIHRYLIWKDRQSDKTESDEWQTEVACNTELLMTCSTLVGAMLEHLKNEVRIPLAKIILFLEENNSWSGSCLYVSTAECVRLEDTATSYADEDNDMSVNAREYWLKCLQDTTLFDITSADIEKPRGGETCTVSRSSVQLKYPFFMRFHQKIETLLQWLLEGTNSLRSHDDHLNMQLCDLIKKNLPSLNYSKYLECHKKDFIYDLLNVFSERFAPNMCPDIRVEVLKSLVVRHEVTLDKASDCFTCICDYYVYIWRNKKTISAELRLISILDTTKVGIRSLIDQLQHLHKGGTPAYESSSALPREAYAIQVLSKDGDDDQIQLMPSKFEEGSSEKDGEVSADNTKQHDLMETEEKLHATTVTEICRAFLPTGRVLDDCGSLDSWQRTANLVLLHAHHVVNETCTLEGEMASDTSIVHFLGLCCDFARLASSLKWTNSDEAVSMLADLANETDLKDVLDNENVFEYIHQQLTDRSTPESNKEEFLSIYFTFCLDANLDTPILRHIILECLVKRQGPLPVGSQPVLLKILHNDLTAQTGQDPRRICEDVISTGNISEDFPNISAIDEVLQGLDRESHFSIVCCDIIEDLAFKDFSWVEIRNIDSGDCHLLITASKAIEIVFNAKDGEGNVPKSSMQYTCCGSYLRAFAKAIAKFFSNRKDPRLFMLDKDHYLLGNELNNMFCNTDEEAHPLLIYVLKCMRIDFTLADLVKWAKELPETIKFSKVLKFQEHLHSSRLGYNPLSYLPHYKETFGAVSAVLMEDGDTARGELDAIIDKAKSDTDQRLGMIAAFSEAFYWVKTTTGLSDTAKEETELLCKRVKKTFQDSFGFLVQHLLTDSVSRDPMNISSTTDAVTLQKVSVILHAACLDIAWKKKFSQRLKTAEREPRDSSQQCIRSDCVCGFSMLYTESQNIPQSCATCNQPFTEDQMVTEVTMDTDDSSKQEFHIMIEAVSQVIRDSVHLFRLLQQRTESRETNPGGTDRTSINVADQSTGAETQASPNVEGSSIESIQANETKVYYEEHFQESWEKARKILDVDDDEIAMLFHTILHDVIKERRRTAFVDTTCDAKIREVLMDLNRHQQKYLQDCLESHGIQESHIEYQINELPYQQDDCYEERMKPRLLRQRIHPTFTEFRKGLLLEVEADGTQFRFLKLYLRYKDALQYIRYLPTFLKWNSLITKRLGKTIERKQAEEQPILSVLSEQKDTANVQLFKEFQKAWNDVCDGWETLKGSTSTFGTMADSKRITACLMDTSDEECPLFQMIKVLQDIQNRFLQNALSIASSTCSSSLNFLIRGDGIGVIHRVSLDKARKEIIDFEWSNNLLQNCDVGAEYGKGCTVSYNFLAIEKVLARRLVMNKAILTDGVVFSHFPFSDELIHASSAILDDIDQHIKQTDLDEDMKTNIISKMNKQKNFANKLLANLEIMIVLLKKTGGEPGKPLEEYIERWSTQLPGSFPRDILPECQVPITLSHVVALYRILEDHLADDYMETLESRFRKTDKKVFDRIKSRMEGVDISQMIPAARVIRLFAFRYLRPCSKVHVDTMNSSLINIMKTSAGDSQTLDLSVLSPVITDDDDVKVYHIYKMQELIEEQIKERETKLKHEQYQLQQQQQSTVQRVDLPPETQAGTQAAAVRRKQTQGTQVKRKRRVGKDPSSMN